MEVEVMNSTMWTKPYASRRSFIGGSDARIIMGSDEAALLRRDPPTGINKCALTIAAPRRYRNKEHLRFVAQQACLVCARTPSDPHHLRFMQPRALGRKVSDEFAVPLCRVHHRALHRTGDERAWWAAAGIDPTKTARNLWRRTRGTQQDQRSERPAKSVQPEIASPPAQTVGPIGVDAGTKALPTLDDRRVNRLPT
jgi:hypothetical protein